MAKSSSYFIASTQGPKKIKYRHSNVKKIYCGPFADIAFGYLKKN